MDQTDEKALPIRHVVPDDVRSAPAQIFVAQHDEDDFTLSFFDVRVPIVLGTEEQRREILSEVKHIDAVCVARVVIAARRLPEVLEVLRQNYETWRDRYGSTAQEEDRDVRS